MQRLLEFLMYDFDIQMQTVQETYKPRMFRWSGACVFGEREELHDRVQKTRLQLMESSK